MKKFKIQFLGSGIYDEYTGVVAEIDIFAVDEYVASEIAKKMIDQKTAYYTNGYEVVEAENSKPQGCGNLIETLEGNMTDKELLELAALAAGYKDIKHDESGFYRVIGEHEDGTLCMTQFNPLTDDGDALRLAVKLGLYIFIDVDKVSTDAPTVTTVEPFNEDPLAATRRAIVRAAAAIGEKL